MHEHEFETRKPETRIAESGVKVTQELHLDTKHPYKLECFFLTSLNISLRIFLLFLENIFNILYQPPKTLHNSLRTCTVYRVKSVTVMRAALWSLTSYFPFCHRLSSFNSSISTGSTSKRRQKYERCCSQSIYILTPIRGTNHREVCPPSRAQRSADRKERDKAARQTRSTVDKIRVSIHSAVILTKIISQSLPSVSPLNSNFHSACPCHLLSLFPLSSSVL